LTRLLMEITWEGLRPADLGLWVKTGLVNFNFTCNCKVQAGLRAFQPFQSFLFSSALEALKDVLILVIKRINLDLEHSSSECNVLFPELIFSYIMEFRDLFITLHY
jgi:hypothetical protein